MRGPKTKTKRRKTPEQRKAEVADLRERLGRWLEEVSPGHLALYTALFDGYSERNAQLIAMQRPDATDVDGFGAWLDRGRCVRKGEKGIRILAPVPYQTGEGQDVEDHLRYRVATVFDISQTDEVAQ
jgi:hypothetical protein